jgi:hypothetical protein
LTAEVERLDNGLTVLVDPDPGNAIVHVELWYRAALPPIPRNARAWPTSWPM